MFFYHSSLSTHESIYGKDHPSTISLVDAIGRLSSVIGDYKQALNCERRVYGFYLKNFGKDSPQTIDLGRLLEELTVSAVAQAKERRIEAHPE